MYVYDLKPGRSSCPYHYEYEEEWLLVIDGRRGHVAGYAESPIGALLPVDWKGETGRPTGLRLTEKGYRVAVLECGRRFADETMRPAAAVSTRRLVRRTT